MDVKTKSNWLNKNITYLKNVIITEYDLHSGGLSVIKENKLLSNDLIQKLESMPKEEKNITIGKLQAKYPKLSSAMVEGFGNARERFVQMNGIPDENILAIKKDALFLVNCANINGNVSNNLVFRNKNSYTTYINICNKEFYLNSLLNELEVKGLGEDTKQLQQDFILKDIKKFLIQSEKISKEMLYHNLNKYRSDYLNKRLPIETYRNLDTNRYTINNFEVETLDQNYVEYIDIRYNFVNYIRPLIIELLK